MLDHMLVLTDGFVSVPDRVLAGDFSGWLSDAMAQRHLTLRMLALQSGVAYTTIHRLAKGSRQPMLDTAIALIAVLERPDTLPLAHPAQRNREP
jgi:DNA-binding XRE family transcriptional regulator